MSKDNKHTYTKYFLLLILAIGTALYIVENTALLEQEILCKYNMNDVENDTDEKKESKEIKKIIIPHLSLFIYKDCIDLTHYFNTKKNYQTRFLGFTTPPPELV